MDKIKRNILYNEKQNGGLNVPNIQSFYSMLENTFLDMVEKFGGDKVLLLNSSGVKEITKHLNSYWKDVFLNWSSIQKEIITALSDILSLPLWFNQNICINSKFVFMK